MQESLHRFYPKAFVSLPKYLELFCIDQGKVELFCIDQGKVFEINGLSVTFSFEELPNDMKMLAMLGGELSNSATYFFTFGNATLENCRDVKGSF